MSKRKLENLNYITKEISLATAHTDELYDMPGIFDHISVLKVTGVASIKLNRKTNHSIDLAQVKVINTPFDKFFLTNAAQAGRTLKLGIGGDASFEVVPTITDYMRVTENIQQRPITSRQRTGRAFFIDTFEHYTAAITEKWTSTVGTVALATDYPKDGLQCMKLTTGAVLGNQADAYLYMGPPPKGRFGVEFDFALADAVAGVAVIQLNVKYDDGGSCYQGRLKYLGPTAKWQFLNNAGADEDIDGGAQSFTVGSKVWHNLKAVFDFAALKYVKLLVDELDFVREGVTPRFVTGDGDLYDIGISTLPYLYVQILIETAAAAAKTLTVDNFILSDMEP
jgi:hypothetical protein